MATIKSQLRINGLELCVHLGWPANEREAEQVVLLDIDIIFPEPPKGCSTDKLEDTYCYSKLTNTIKDHLAGMKIHLIENLTREIYDTIKKIITAEAKITVHLTKHPKINGLTNGVTFSYGDGP